MKSAKYKVIFTLLVIAGFTSFGCRKQVKNPQSYDTPATQTAGGLEFILETTDMNGNFKSHFSEGENFKLTLEIVNHTNQNMKLCDCFLTLTNPNLLTVYAAHPLSSPKHMTYDINDSIGKPWDGSGGVAISPITFIRANSNIRYSLPWHITDTTVKYFAPEPIQYLGFHVVQNANLPKGMYYTKFNFNYSNTVVNLKYYFSIL